MAEAVAGLSLAANILQMVEYGGVFVTTAWKMYSAHSDNDVMKDFKQLQYLAKDVDKVLGSLEQDIPAFSSTSMSSENGDPQLARLAEECRKVTVEILEFVGNTGDQKSWKTRMRKAVKEAFQLTWGQDKLHKLETELDRMRNQLILRLVHSLRHFAAESSETQKLILSKMTEGMKYSNHKIDEAFGSGLGTVSVDFIAQKLAGRRPEHLRESLKSEILQAMSETSRDAEVIEPKPFEIASSRRQTLKEKLLENLSYPDMLVRERSVVRASETTFRWIFEREKRPDRPWASFCEWLEAPDKQLYWITGKPGSGKSTLMKFILQPAGDEPMTEQGKSVNAPRCLSFLQSWAGTHPLIVVSYYFWASGSPIQKSKEGMLRTLLHGLLSQVNPEVIATIMPRRWEALHLFDEDPCPHVESSLQELLSHAFEFMCRSMKICLFIDGLDEFEGQHEDLILYLSAAIGTHPIKVCVSSRQWQVFEDAFHQQPSLRLQNLTLPDMVEYVRSELYDEPAFTLLQNLDPSFSGNLDENIALRADGVFLWLNLVVKSFRKGIRAGEHTSDLQRRLNQLPSDLEALFDRILGELDPEFLDHAIQYFKLMEASREIGPLNVMVFSYADEENDLVGIDCPVSPLDKKTYQNRRDQLKRRLNSRCMGLLEITEQSSSQHSVFVDAWWSRVNYLHRTVGDYIARDEVRERLIRRAGRGSHQSYDPHLRLCSSELAFSKSSPLELPSSNDFIPSDQLIHIIGMSLNNCLCHAAKVQKPRLQSMIRLVDELGNYGEANCPRFTEVYKLDDLRTRPEMLLRLHEGSPFVSFVIRRGVVEYIRVKALQERSQTVKLWHKVAAPVRKRRIYTACAADAWSDLEWQLSHAVLSTSPSPAIVELLLERGADPQYKDPHQKLSTWVLALMVYIHFWHGEPQTKQKSEEIVALMIKYGAPIERKSIMKACEWMGKWNVVNPWSPVKLRVSGDVNFVSNVEMELKTMKQRLR